MVHNNSAAIIHSNSAILVYTNSATIIHNNSATLVHTNCATILHNNSAPLQNILVVPHSCSIALLLFPHGKGGSWIGNARVRHDCVVVQILFWFESYRIACVEGRRANL